MSPSSHEVFTWREGRPLGVWLFTVCDALLWGALPLLVGVVSLVGAGNLDTAAMIDTGEPLSPIVQDRLDYMANGMRRSMVFEGVLNLVLGAVTLIAAVGTWKGNDLLRMVLLGVITMYGVRFLFEGGTAVLVIVLLVGFHWWYFTRATTLYFFQQYAPPDDRR